MRMDVGLAQLAHACLDGYIPNWQYDGVQQILDVLAEPQRRRIVELLGEREVLVGDLVSQLGLRQPTVSKHLKVMREAGVVSCRADAQRRWYRLRADSLRELDEWLEPYRRLWAGRLDALQRHLDEMEDE